MDRSAPLSFSHPGFAGTFTNTANDIPVPDWYVSMPGFPDLPESTLAVGSPTIPESIEFHSSRTSSLPEPNNSSIAARLKVEQACDECRRRRTKCDNERPSCGSCQLRKPIAKNPPPPCSYSKVSKRGSSRPRDASGRFTSRASRVSSVSRGTYSESPGVDKVSYEATCHQGPDHLSRRAFPTLDSHNQLSPLVPVDNWQPVGDSSAATQHWVPAPPSAPFSLNPSWIPDGGSLSAAHQVITDQPESLDPLRLYSEGEQRGIWPHPYPPPDHWEPHGTTPQWPPGFQPTGHRADHCSHEARHSHYQNGKGGV